MHWLDPVIETLELVGRLAMDQRYFSVLLRDLFVVFGAMYRVSLMRCPSCSSFGQPIGATAQPNLAVQVAN